MARSKRKTPVSVIVCVYNEEKHLEQTLKDLLNCPTAEEIIVVNDGSTDKSERILKSFASKITLISYRKNRGKGYALSLGLNRARGKVVVFLDAHLKNLKDDHLKRLVSPILQRKTNYALGYYRMQAVKSDFFANLTGQRAYLKEILIPFLPNLKKTRFGVETYLNEIFKPRWGKIIYFSGLIHFVKHQNMPFNEVLPAYLHEVIEIYKTKTEIKLQQYHQLKKILNPKKIKSLRTLSKKLNQIKDQEVIDLIKSNLIPYLKKITQ